MKTKLMIQKLEMIDLMLFRDLNKLERKGIRDTLIEIKDSIKGGQYENNRKDTI